MKKFVIVVVILIIYTISNNVIVENVPKKIPESSREELFELLKIEECPSFEFLYITWLNTHEYFDCLELKFKISRQDYEQNELKYAESYHKVLFDCNYIEKKENDIYTCVVKRTNTELSDKEISYEKLLKIKRDIGKYRYWDI